MATDYDKELREIRDDIDILYDKKADAEKGKRMTTNDFTDDCLDKVNRIGTEDYHKEIVSGVAKDIKEQRSDHTKLADEVHRHIRYGSESDNKFKKDVEDSLKNVVNLVNKANSKMNDIEKNWDNLVKEDKDHEGRITQLEGQSARYDVAIDVNTGAIESIQGEQVIQNNRIDEIQNKSVELETRVVDVEASDVDQNHRLDIAENRIGSFTDRMTDLEDGYAQRDARMDALDAQVTRYSDRILAVELNEKAQNERIKAEVEKNKRQDIDIACLYAEAKDRTINVDTEGTAIELQNSREGFVVTNSIEGNTMVNCNKDVDKELTLLTSPVDVSSDNNVTLTEGVVDGGLVDVYLEGNTLVNVSKTREDTPITHESEDTTGNHISLADEGSMRPVLNGNTLVNVCDQRDSVAITKSYTVETGNHVALQGEYDGKCRPVVTGNTLVDCLRFKNYYNKHDNILIEGNKLIFNGVGHFPEIYYSTNLFKPNTQYTIIGNLEKRTDGVGENQFIVFRIGEGDMGNNTTVYAPSVLGQFKIQFTTPSNIVQASSYLRNTVPVGEQCIVSDLIILEGDYTNKPIPGYFEGLKSSFEDKVVTQEMVDAGEESAENLGKYKVDYVVTGKNKLDINDYWVQPDFSEHLNIENGVITGNHTGKYYDFQMYVYLQKDVNYILSCDEAFPILNMQVCKGRLEGWAGDNKVIGRLDTHNLLPKIPETGWYTLHIVDLNQTLTNLQIEEGNEATEYEEYKEYKKTFYLNSPLLEGDTIEQQGNNIYHVHRYGKVVLDGSSDEGWRTYSSFANTKSILCYSDSVILGKLGGKVFSDNFILSTKPLNNFEESGIYLAQYDDNLCLRILGVTSVSGFTSYLQQNPTTVVYELFSPTYEVISQNDTILCDSYVNGHLDVDSVVPIDRVVFTYTGLKCKYLYPLSTYVVQFESDNIGIIDGLSLGGAEQFNISINKGINKINAISGDNTSNPYLDLKGIGFNASNIVVTPAIEQDFDYFSGMQSCFEDNLVTEGENAGKYEVSYRVTGKNKLNLPEAQNTWAGASIYANGNTVKFIPNADGNIGMAYIPKFTPINIKQGSKLMFSVQKMTDTSWTSGTEALGILMHYKDGTQVKVNTSDFYGSSSINTVKHKIFTVEQDVVDIGLYALGYYVTGASGGHVYNVQLEYATEGQTEATSYEPYKEYTKTLYLNSPLLEGDTIEEKDGNIYHVHRYNKVVLDGSENWSSNAGLSYVEVNDMSREYDYTSIILCDKLKTSECHTTGTIENYSITGYSSTDKYPGQNWIYLLLDGSADAKAWLQTNPVTVVYKLATPQYELIQQGTIAMPTYSAGHLDVTSAVPVDKVNFLHFEEELTYLYPSTQYTVQFVSDNAATVDIMLGGKKLLVQSVTTGLNKITITTPETLPDNKLIIDGVNANISEVVVTNTDREFGYFEGMKSVGECEDLEVVSCSKNLWNWNDLYNQYGNTDANLYKKFNGILTKINNDEYSIIPYQGGWYEQGIFSTPIYLKNGETISFSGIIKGCRNIAIYKLDNFLETVSGVIQVDENLDEYKSFNVSYTVNKDGYYVARFWISNNKEAYARNIQFEKSSTATDYIPHASNTQTLTHEPLRSVGDIKDKYVLVDGKWYIERNCGEVTLDGSDDEDWTDYAPLITDDFFACYHVIDDTIVSKSFKCDTFKKVSITVNGEEGIDTYSVNNVNYVPRLRISKSKLSSNDINGVRNYLSNNPMTIVYRLATPTYEPIDYNPFEVYSEVTHISANSTIPCNATVKNHGYNCILKPSTTYTVVSNQGVQNMTTPATLGDSLRFSGNGVLKDVMILEGTLSDNQIPGFFAGMESSFEQHKITDEYDEHFGYYEVNAKVVGKNLFDKNAVILNKYQNSNAASGNYSIVDNPSYKVSGFIRVMPGTRYNKSNANYIGVYYDIHKKPIKGVRIEGGSSFITPYNCHYVVFTFGIEDDISTWQLEQGTEATPYEPYKESNIKFYIKDPLRGIGDIKDKVFVEDGKVKILRNCASVTLDGSDDDWREYEDVNARMSHTIGYFTEINGIHYLGSIKNLVCDNLPTGVYDEQDTEGCKLGGSPHIHLYISRAKLQTQDVAGFKQWLQQNPTTVVYQLAEPVIEEVDYNGIRLSQVIWENSTMFFDTNIPSSANISYSISIPVLDQVAEVSSVTDDQDALIIDMATQLAVLSMTM